MRVIQCEQGTAQWLEARRGLITASRISDVLDQLKKGGEGASRRNYRIELIAERLSGRAEDHYVSPDMQWGTDIEPFARAAYEMETGNDVDQVGFVLHPSMDCSGASPDGLVGKVGGIECKCPKTTTHLKWMLAGVVPEEHQDQCLWVMECCELEWIDFVSFDPRLPEGLKLFTRRMKRDEARISKVRSEVLLFNDEVESISANLQFMVKRADTPIADTRSAFEQALAAVEGEIVP